MTPLEGERPVLLLSKEPSGMVVAKVPTWSVTGSVRGLIAGAVLLKVMLDPNPKASWLERCRIAMASRRRRRGRGRPAAAE